MSNSPISAFRALSRPGDGFPSPWLDVASLAMPIYMKDVLLWCFPPGTLIEMSSGENKPIELVRPGDYVRTAQGRSRKVTKCSARNWDGELVNIAFAGHGLKLPLKTTPNHKIFRKGVDGLEQVAASDVCPGDFLFSPKVAHEQADDGLYRKVLSVTHSNYQGFVYGLEVEEDHSYVADGVAVGNCQFIWYNSSTYRRAQERIISYFLTEVEIGSVRPNESLGEDEKEKYETLLSDELSIATKIWEMQINKACYGNAFCTMHTPFRRYLMCPKCTSTFPLREVAENSVFQYRWSNFQFVAKCPKCATGSGYTGPWRVFDPPDKLDKNLGIKVWSPHEIEIRHDILSGHNEYVWRIHQDYKNQIRKGNLFELERCPVAVMKAIQNDQLFKFHPGVMFHMKEPTLSGIMNRGWGIPRILTNFRDIWYVQVLRRYNEAIALDYVVPFRLLTPEPRNGSGMSQGMLVDPLLTDNMGDFRGQMEHLLRQRRADPARWNILPFPVRYQALGGDAQQLAPRELLDQGVDIMLNAAGAPAQLYRSDLTIQAAPVALRLFESDNVNLIHDNNLFLGWVVDQISQILGYEPVRATMKRVTTADDFQKQMAILQMVMGGMVSRTDGLKLLGLSFKDQQRLIAEEARYEQQMQAEIQEEMEQDAFGQQIAKGQGMGPAGAPPGAGAPPQGGDPSQGGAAPTGPVTGMLMSGSTPQTPQDMLATADSIATELLAKPDSERRSELAKLRQSHDALHGLVLKRMNQKRNQARSQGAAMILGQQQQQGPPQ